MKLVTQIKQLFLFVAILLGQPFNTWRPVKVHTYLSKPAAFLKNEHQALKGQNNDACRV